CSGFNSITVLHSAPATANHLLKQLNGYNLQSLVLLSTSFPIDKPASNTSRSSACYDVAWQSNIDRNGISPSPIYGDYAATNPTAPMEYIPGMPVLPFGCYYTPTEWWQRRKGGNKEFVNYIEIAREVRNLPGYHGDDFCWATREYSRIVTTSTGYGNNGTWNGYRINQHICAMILSITDGANEEFDEFDFDDLV
ncbi:beta family protein, partial [Pseudomonas helleri]|uniref:beta family protein n=1 Tax=Pseudomonas helleri TaxID=1608996 RepID=UPI003F9460AD